MKRVLIYHKSFGAAVGGGDYLPLALVSALQKTCEVTLALDWPSDLARAAALCGVDVDPGRVETVAIKPRNGFIGKIDLYFPFYRVRRLKRLAENADVCISTCNIIDFGRPAHHFIVNVPSYRLGRESRDVRSRPLLARVLRKALAFVADAIVRPALGFRSPRKIVAAGRDWIYPNSRYAERAIAGHYGAAPARGAVFYPPTLFEARGAAAPRDPLLVACIGRICPEKRVAEMIGIVERARAITGEDIRLAVAGTLDGSPYATSLREAAAGRKWCRFAGEVYGEEKEKFLLSATYAIHAERDEAFGIAVTEYLKAGAIPIVPDEGGTPEIVDSPGLAYGSDEDAARILARLVSDGPFREEQRRHCAARAEFFSREAYFGRQRGLVAGILEP